MKTCSRCGKEKPLEEFRPYYGNRKGHYKYCKTCEKIESHRKYLSKLVEPTPEQLEDLHNIERLYEARRAKGLDVPQERGANTKMHDLLKEVLDEEL